MGNLGRNWNHLCSQGGDYPQSLAGSADLKGIFRAPSLGHTWRALAKSATSWLGGAEAVSHLDREDSQARVGPWGLSWDLDAAKASNSG
jgi:hypothetical protein